MHARLCARARAHARTHGAHRHLHRVLDTMTSSHGDQVLCVIGTGDGHDDTANPDYLNLHWAQLRPNVFDLHKFGFSTFFANFLSEIQSRLEIVSRM